MISYDIYIGVRFSAFSYDFMKMDDATEQCVISDLKEGTGLRVKNAAQIGVYPKVDYGPRGSIITVAYLTAIENPVEVTGWMMMPRQNGSRYRTCNILHFSIMILCWIQYLFTK